MSKKYREQNDCLNCGSIVNDKFCNKCGQENLNLNEPFWHYLGHNIAHYFHFDTKLFQTIFPLLTKPGTLTLEYTSGKRTKHFPPLNMYIFISIIYFFVISIFNQQVGEAVDQGNQKSKLKKEQIEKLTKTFIQGIEDSVINSNDKSQSVIWFKSLPFYKQKSTIDSLKKTKGFNKDLLLKFNKLYIDKEDSTYASYLIRQNRLSIHEQDNILVRFLIKQKFKFNKKQRGNLDFTKLSDQYKSKVYFVLMPLFAYFIMLGFRRNKKYYLEHLIFTVHIFTAFFILEIITLPILHVTGGLFTILLELFNLIVVIWYVYTALKLFYGRSTRTTIFKMIYLSIVLIFCFAISSLVIGSMVFLTA